MPDLSPDELCKVVSVLVKDAEDYRDERSHERMKAMTFFDGESKDMQKYIPADDGRSQLVSRDVRSQIKKVLPSIYRTILGNDRIVEYQPVGEGDEESAEQATDYVNVVALPECDGRQAIEDAINDAVRLRNGIIKWWLDERTDVKVSLHTGLDDMALALLTVGDDIEVIEHTARQEQVDGEQGPVETTVHDVKIRRKVTTKTPRLGAVPLENWLIHPDAVRLDDSPILGEALTLRRSDLVKMGYEKSEIWKLPAATADTTEREVEEDQRRRDIENREDAPQKALDEIDYYDLLVRVDKDGDGIAELRRMVFAGGIKAEYLLEDVEWDEVNYADIVSERRPHQWEGNSVTDDVMDIQTVNTVLLRQTADNLYWQNNLQPIVQEGKVVNPSSVLNPKFGEPIRVEAGTDVREAVGYSSVPLVADKSFAMIEFMKKEATERTGISDASSGMAPDALQNMTAKASAMVEAAGIGQTEMMVRCIASSLKPVFRGLLKLIIQHQDKPRTVRLRDKWVEYDPRTWNADMDATVNTGLGAGTRERDMLAMQQVITLQKEVLASMGPTVGMQYVTPDNLYNAISKMVEAAGLKTVSLYFSKPDPQQIQQAIQQQSSQPSPEQVKAEAALKLEQVRTQGKMQIENVKVQAKQQEFGAKMQAEASKEREQRDADLATNLAEMDRQAAIDGQQIEADTLNKEADRQVEREGMALNYQMHREKIESQEEIAARNQQAQIERAHAQAFERDQRGGE
ncbi:portal protein [Afipia carboxidovorans]|uniref:portal protein n=1 Tax=Afipia carboxidovorans TaxID=40137 RepID=UPI00308661AF|nr:phage portal protein [Afipia carboxidovorans]